MRLLKQDKRRRGETIGKLLRCLDDMKDQGKLDETKVTDGRLLLAATVNTRGWSTEDRIYAAVEAMETERGKHWPIQQSIFYFYWEGGARSRVEKVTMGELQSIFQENARKVLLWA